jgi:hypothetical protein
MTQHLIGSFGFIGVHYIVSCSLSRRHNAPYFIYISLVMQFSFFLSTYLYYNMELDFCDEMIRNEARFDAFCTVYCNPGHLCFVDYTA